MICVQRAPLVSERLWGTVLGTRSLGQLPQLPPTARLFLRVQGWLSSLPDCLFPFLPFILPPLAFSFLLVGCQFSLLFSLLSFLGACSWPSGETTQVSYWLVSRLVSQEPLWPLVSPISSPP